MVYTYSDYMSEEFISNYLQPYLNTVIRNLRTTKEYAGYLRILCNEVKKDFLDITADDAFSVMSKWESKMRSGKLARKTICVRLSCYNSLCKYISELNVDYISPFSGISRPHVSDHISPALIPSMKEIDMIMTVASDDDMYYLILALVTRSCLTATRITQLTVNSVIREGDKVALLFPTSNVDSPYDVVALPEDVIPLFNKYCESIQLLDEKGHLFYNRWGNALTIKNLDSAISKIVKKSNVSHQYTLKDLRARGILEMINAGADETSIMKYTGLGSMRTRQFAEAKGLIAECPADLVNYRLKK